MGCGFLAATRGPSPTSPRGMPPSYPSEHLETPLISRLGTLGMTVAVSPATEGLDMSDDQARSGEERLLSVVGEARARLGRIAGRELLRQRAWWVLGAGALTAACR